ncbi:M14 family metallopeptidase [Streptomyces sp. NBC_00555]|uniref:M14 family metallopeptidase n=1 Tax=Streptomyces sp. NBC_00555 TaxID=2903662 RepID=UPI00225647D1|nr:M14 family metallopeptidase [Streptomyces sp. NBC_00555]MCX5016003.1 M14 family metallopeptidase [Streptomyces sp. NBC_00555]
MADVVFPSDYSQARGDFLRAAEAAGARRRTYALPGHRGPDGGELCVDTAYVGPPDPEKLLVTVSGTHGIEGFCGSACQTGILLREGVAREAGPRTGVLLVHALNPYGFAYLRRVNEDNVDLNRNFVDHGAPPHNDAYDAVHATLVPPGSPAFSPHELVADLTVLRERLGPQTLQEAVTRGQYRHADGLFYGGLRPTWSRRVFQAVVAEQIAGAAHVAYIDLHTGLGERGVGEPIFRGGRDAHAHERARRWYGDALTASELGTSSSTPIVGNTATAVADGLGPGSRLTAITLEFGTQPGPEVLLALCADAWLHRHSSPAEAVGSELKQLIRAAFCPADDATWRERVSRRAREVFGQALAGLADAKPGDAG